MTLYKTDNCIWSVKSLGGNGQKVRAWRRRREPWESQLPAATLLPGASEIPSPPAGLPLPRDSREERASQPCSLETGEELGDCCRPWPWLCAEVRAAAASPVLSPGLEVGRQQDPSLTYL